MIKADLINRMGNDLTVVNAARVSFDKESDWDTNRDGTYAGPRNRLSAADAKLVTYLAKHDHFTPFTHCMITLRETIPIFVARQRFKHTVGFSYNEVSRRYVDDTPEFYIPGIWRSRPEGSVKQGSGGPIQHMKYVEDKYAVFLNAARHVYDAMLEVGVAPEQARMVLPQSMLTSYYVTGSLSAFARAYKLRSDEHAQQEIQELAQQWDQIIRPLYPVSWAALVD